MTNIPWSVEGEEWKYSIVMFLYYTGSGIISFEGRLW